MSTRFAISYLWFFIAGLACCLAQTQGTYEAHLVVFFTLSFGGLVYFGRELETGQNLALTFPCFVVAGFVIQMMGHSVWVYENQSGFFALFRTFLILGTFLTLGLCFFRVGASLSESAERNWLFLLLGLYSLLYWLTVLSFPEPTIDVFFTSRTAIQFFQEGLNPYLQKYPDIYQGKIGYEPSFSYWPAVLYTLSLGHLILGDLRYTNLIAILGTAACFPILASKLKVNKNDGLWFSLLWLTLPMGLYIVEQAWIDPQLCLCVSLAMIAWHLKKPIFLGCALGWLAATKQYGFFVPFYFLILLSTQKDWATCKTLIISCVTIVLLTFAPFLSHPQEFWSYTIAMPLSWPMRHDSFSLVAFLANTAGISTGAWFPIGVTLLALIAGAIWIRRHKTLGSLLEALTFLYGCIFLTGKQSFCNYYYYLLIFPFWRLFLLNARKGGSPLEH